MAFLAIIGGYYDITAAITYLTTGFYRPAPDALWRRGPVSEHARWVFLRANADRAAPEDADLLEEIAARRLVRPPRPVGDLVARLGPRGRSVWALLSNSDPERVPRLIAALPAPLRRDIRALDLASRPLERLDMPVLLIHGRNDPMVPFTESRALAARLGPDQAELTVVDGLAHVDVGGIGVGDALALVAASYRLLSLRDQAPAPAQAPAGLRTSATAATAPAPAPRPGSPAAPRPPG